MNVDQLQKSGRILYEFVSGSHAYGLSTPKSDVDIRGLFYLSQKELLSLKPHTPDPISDDKNDTSYYSIGRFFDLAKDVNPNIIEFLWSPEDCIRIKSEISDKIIENRSLFISKKAKHTFTGYAHAQLKKCQGTNKLVHNPQPEEKPKKEDFCYFVNVLSSGTMLEQWEDGSLTPNPDNMPCRPLNFTEKKLSVLFDLPTLRVAAVEHIGNLYRLYRNGKGVFRDGQLVCDSIPIDQEWENFIGLMIYNEQAYDKAMKDHKNYWDWIKNRNEARWVSQEKGNLTYDSKNVMHCIRLLISGINILKNGEPIVRFSGEQQKFLMNIRGDKFEYDYLMKFADEKMLELDELYKTSTIPNTVDMDKIDDLYLEILDDLGVR